jgi:hypothetical protein
MVRLERVVTSALSTIKSFVRSGDFSRFSLSPAIKIATTTSKYSPDRALGQYNGTAAPAPFPKELRLQYRRTVVRLERMAIRAGRQPFRSLSLRSRRFAGWEGEQDPS